MHGTSTQQSSGKLEINLLFKTFPFIVSSLPNEWSPPTWASDAFIRKMIGEAIPPLMCKKIVEPIIGNEIN